MSVHGRILPLSTKFSGLNTRNSILSPCRTSMLQRKSSYMISTLFFLSSTLSWIITSVCTISPINKVWTTFSILQVTPHMSVLSTISIKGTIITVPISSRVAHNVYMSSSRFSLITIGTTVRNTRTLVWPLFTSTSTCFVSRKVSSWTTLSEIDL